MKTFPKSSLLAAAAALCVSGASYANDYYFSPAGDDAGSGASASAPWKSFDKLSGLQLSSGDRILLEGGATFTQDLVLDGNAHGTADRPVTITSYGSGRATLKNMQGNGMELTNVDGLLVENLDISGETCASSQPAPASCQSASQCTYAPGAGIIIQNTGSRVLRFIHIRNVDIGGYDIKSIQEASSNGGPDGNGIYVDSSADKEGSITDLAIESSVIHDISRAGIRFNGSGASQNIKDVRIADNSIFDIFGVPKMHSLPGKGSGSGNGMLLVGVNGALIQGNQVHDNGCLDDEGGNNAIWAYFATALEIRGNEVWKNTNRGPHDGGGIDFDYNVMNSTMENNYSHDNAGFGFLFAQPPGGYSGHLLIQNNVSRNDGRRNGYGGFGVWGPVYDSQIVGNTVYITRSTESPGKLPSGSVVLQFMGSNLKIAGNKITSDGVAPHMTFYSGNWTTGDSALADDLKKLGVDWEDNEFLSPDGRSTQGLIVFDNKRVLAPSHPVGDP